MDEKSQIQALDRTQPGLPMKRVRAGTWTHDYLRHGTTTLFAALNMASGKVSGACFSRHRHQEFLRLLRQIDQEYEPQLKLHLVMDNYGTHKIDPVKRWLGRHPRFKMHFIPTSSSWMNMVERWFAELTGKAVRRGSFECVPDLIEAIAAFIRQWNRNRKPSSNPVTTARGIPESRRFCGPSGHLWECLSVFLNRDHRAVGRPGGMRRHPLQKAWRDVPALSVLGDNADGLLVVAGDHSRHRRPSVGMKGDPFADPKLKHRRMRRELPQKL
jgi:transposase